MVFAIHWHESAMDLHVFPIPIPVPTSLSTRSLWVFPVHQPQALVSCIQPGLVICFTLDNIHVSMLFWPPPRDLLSLAVCHLPRISINVALEFVVQLRSCVWLSATPWIAVCQVPLSSTFSQNLLLFMSVGLVLLSNHLILCCPLLLLPSAFPSTRVFSNESALCIMWPKYWSFSFSFSSSNEYSGLISFRNDWFDLAVQGILKSLLQHHLLSILWIYRIEAAFLWWVSVLEAHVESPEF